VDNWAKYIDDLNKIFSSITLPPGPVKLDAATTINDVKKFIESHMAIARSHNGNRFFIPYMERLYQLKRILITKPAE
jgi:hypothetical protein